jgi:heat shock protein HslJ
VKRATAVLAVLLMSACGGDMTSPSDLSGGTWHLAVMEPEGSPSFVPPDPSRFTVTFEEDGRIGLRADCNVCGGDYTLDDDTLVVEPLACTLALCAPSGGEAFAGLVMGRSAVEVEGAVLRLESDRGRLTLRR